jgi:predicted glycosyltransferase
MRILVDLNHPAHVHLFRHPVQAWRARGDSCLVVARDKDVALQLLRAYDIPFKATPAGRGGVLGGTLELVTREWRVLQLARRFKPDVITGTSAHAARVARMLGARSLFLTEDDTAAVPLSRWVCLPFATAIVTPTCLAYENHGAHHLTYRSYQELFYLHPRRFEADRAAVQRLLGDEPYGIVRLSALRAYHDIGQRGLTTGLVTEVIRRAQGRLKVFVNSEGTLDRELEAHRLPIAPEQAHHVLAGARFFLGDSQTMTAEAAVLGVPAFRYSGFVGRLSYLEELQGYGLAFGFRPGQEQALLAAMDPVLTGARAADTFAEKRRLMLADRIDPLPWFLEVFDRVVAHGA